jgi:hypothetical protein
VTHIDGSRVYAFGHPFLNLGPTSMTMTQARVFTVLPSLDSSMKIATLGPSIGTMTQDRATAVAGVLGSEPPQVTVGVTLRSSRAEERRLEFKVLHDQTLTPLFSYVAVLNALAAYERQSGPLTINLSGEVSFGQTGRVKLDDIFAGRRRGGTGGGRGSRARGNCRDERLPSRTGRSRRPHVHGLGASRTARQSSAYGSTRTSEIRRHAHAERDAARLPRCD